MHSRTKDDQLAAETLLSRGRGYFGWGARRGEKEKEDRRWMDGKERGGGRWDGGINHDVVD